MKLGQVVEFGGPYLVTSIYPHGLYGGEPFAVLTSIPDGMTPEDYGHKFHVALVWLIDRQPSTHLPKYGWNSAKRAGQGWP